MRFSLLVAALLAARAASAAEAEPLEVTVRVFDTAGVPDRWMNTAQRLTETLYAGLGITIRFAPGDRAALAALDGEPRRPVLPGCGAIDRIDMRLYADRPSLRPAVLAEAQPFQRSGVRVHIAMARVLTHARANGVPADVTLGLVMAHELGHMLIGSDGHEPAGLMRAQMSRSEMLDPISKLLLFEEPQLNLMRRNIRLSARGCEVVAARQ